MHRLCDTALQKDCAVRCMHLFGRHKGPCGADLVRIPATSTCCQLPRIARLLLGRTRCPVGVSGLLSCELCVSLFRADIWFLLLPLLPAAAP